MNYFSVFALNECFPTDNATAQTGYVNWRAKLDSQRGAVLANELRNNAWKMARWTVEALLAEAQQIKLGYVSRVAPKNPARGHVVLATQFFKPTDLSTQLNVSMQQGWGVIKSLVDLFLNHEDGLYILLKDPAEQKVKLYALPQDAKLPGYGEPEASAEDEQGEQ